MIQAGIGRFGPYVKMGAIFGSLDKDDDVLAIGINRAVDLIARKMASVRTVGAHPNDKELISVRKGRFGPYVQHGMTVANLPRGVAMEDVTIEDAVALLAEKGKALKPRGGKKGAAGKAPRKAAPKKAAVAAEATEAPARMAPARKAPAKTASATATRKRATGGAKKAAAKRP